MKHRQRAGSDAVAMDGRREDAMRAPLFLLWHTRRASFFDRGWFQVYTMCVSAFLSGLHDALGVTKLVKDWRK